MGRRVIVLDTENVDTTCEFSVDDNCLVCIHERAGQPVSEKAAASSLAVGDKICAEFIIGLDHNGSPARSISSITTE